MKKCDEFCKHLLVNEQHPNTEIVIQIIISIEISNKIIKTQTQTQTKAKKKKKIHEQVLVSNVNYFSVSAIL